MTVVVTAEVLFAIMKQNVVTEFSSDGLRFPENFVEAVTAQVIGNSLDMLNRPGFDFRRTKIYRNVNVFRRIRVDHATNGL